MESGDDYVAARLSIDIPTEGVQGVRELTESVDRFRTAMEQATRAEADMSTYLNSMGEAARKATEFQAGLVEQLSQMVTLQGHLSGAPAGGQPSYLVPGGFTAPFQGQTGGLGAQPGMRIPNPTDVTYQLQQHSQNSPREYRNMVAARGGVDTSPGVNLSAGTVTNLSSQIAQREHATRQQDHQTGSGAQSDHSSSSGGGGGTAADPFDKFRERTQAATGFAGQVMGELGAHDGIPFLPIAQQGISAARGFVQKRRDQSASQNKDEEGADKAPGTDGSDQSTPTGGLDKVLGGAGGALAAVGALFGLVQSGGQMVQGWRNIASVRGGSAGEGLEASFNARMQASNPYLTTDQTRQMLQAGLSEGYLDASGNPMGKQGGQAMAFMSDNLQKYNMDPSQSVDFLRMAAKGTTLSIGELSQSLDTLKNVVKGGGPLSQSLPDMINQVQQKSSSLMAQGVNPEQALQQGMNSAVAFNGNPLLQGTMSGMQPNAQGTADERLHGGAGGAPLDIPPGLTPDAIQQYIDDKYPDQSPMYNALEFQAKRIKGIYRDTNDQDKNPQGWFNARMAFFRYIQQHFPSSAEAQDKEKAYALYDQFAWDGKTAKDIVSSNKKAIDDGSADARKTFSTGTVGGIDTTFGNVGGTSSYSSQAINNIVQGYGGGGKGVGQIQVEDGKGGWTAFDPTNQKQVQDFDDDKIRWRRKGDTGKGLTLEDTPGSTNDQFSTDSPGNPKGIGGEGKGGDPAGGDGGNGGMKGSVKIDLSDDAKKLLQIQGGNPVPLTPTQKGANAGNGDAQVNNPNFNDQSAIQAWISGSGW